MLKRLTLLGCSILAVITLVSPSPCHNYFAPYLYLSGIYSPTGEPVHYPTASDAEMAWLEKQLEDKSVNVRAIAAGALGQTKSPKAVEPLLRALNDPSETVQMNARMAFFHIKDPRAVEPLKQYLTGNHRLATMGDYYALVAQGDEGIDALLDTKPFNEPVNDGEVYGWIAEGVVTAMGSEALQWAVATLKGPNSKRYPVALAVLDMLETNEPADPVKKAVKDPEVADRIIVLAQTNDAYQSLAVHVLKGSSDPRVAQIEKALTEARNAFNKEELSAGRETPRALTAAEVKSYAAELRKISAKSDASQKLDSQEAAYQLARSSNPTGVRVLVKVLNETNVYAAQCAAEALSTAVENPEARAALMAVLDNPKHPGYKETVQMVVHFGDKDIITRLLRSKDDFAVHTALIDLQDGHEMNLRADILPLLKNPKHRQDAGLALASFSDPAAIDPLVEMLKDEAKSGGVGTTTVCQDLLKYGKPAIDKVIARFRDRDPWMRAGAAWFFAQVKEPRAVDPLIGALGDPAVQVRWQAVTALIFQNDAKAAPHFARALTDPDPAVRKEACRAAAFMPDPSASAALGKLLKDKDRSTRICSGLALAQLGDKRGASAIMPVLSSEDSSELVVPTIRAAGKLNYKPATAAIIRLLGADVKMSVVDPGTEEELDAARSAKLEALRSLTGQDFGYAFYRWMAWWGAQGNKPIQLFPDAQPKTDEWGDPVR